MGGAPKIVTRASRISVRQRSRSLSAMPLADSPGPFRSWNSFSMTYIEPRFGALAFRIKDWPEMPTVALTPGISWAIVSSRAMIS